ncbi:hypothetical protein NSP_40170 [Nodularia spumigena CCY9414]|nr:hypothetical protein NSP_40170 [Nodularia spumigena CCY9414]
MNSKGKSKTTHRDRITREIVKGGKTALFEHKLLILKRQNTFFTF